jgi:hypothetical protein
LPLHQAISDTADRLHVVAQIVENELPGIGLDRQHGMPLVVLVAHHGHQQRLAGKAAFDQHLALQQGKIFAIALAVHRIVPAIDHAPMLHVGHGFDCMIDPGIDLLDLAHRLVAQVYVGRGQAAAVAFALVALAEFDPTEGDAGFLADRGVSDVLTAESLGGSSRKDEGRESESEAGKIPKTHVIPL